MAERGSVSETPGRSQTQQMAHRRGKRVTPACRFRTLGAISILATFRLLVTAGSYIGENFEGPRFTQEPAHLVRFSNDTGALLRCEASGEPPPAIAWYKNDGSKVGNVPGLLRTSANGTVEFLPFAASGFRPDIHSTTYHCVAQNPVGVVVSRDIKVRAVVLQSYEARVYNQYVIPGNTAVFKCFVPLFIEEDITVTAWVIKQSDSNIFPALEGDGKYHMLPSGDLLVLDVGPGDVHLEFNCRYVNRLTGETFMSTRPGKIGLKNPTEPEAPRFNEVSMKVKVKEGENVVLPCVAGGLPPPDVRWSREFSGSQRDSLFTSGERVRVGPSVLLIKKAMIGDSGTYWCEAVNPLGKEDLKILLEVYSPLAVLVQPRSQAVNFGHTATLTCSMSGHPIQSFSWLKDGHPLRQTGRASFQATGNVLVIRKAEKEDMGVYQCVAKNARDMVQNAAQLRLGDSRPQFLYLFISQTLQPGPMVSLKCVAVGNPPPHIQWTLDGYPLSDDDSRVIIGQYVTVHGEVISHVNISSIQAEDGGTYSCTAKNREGEVSHSARLNVYGPPSIRVMPDLAAVAEEVLRIHCPAAGYPLQSISWEKDFKSLPLNNRQKVLDNGTLIISKLQKESDNGTYTCVVKDKQGLSVQRTVDVTVLAPPRLNSFPPIHNLKIGERVGLHCMISSGDPPISLTWVKDGDRLAGELAGVTVRTVDAHNSLLTIERVTRDHAGNYSCLARNPVAEAKETAEIVINEPPKWISQPKDASAVLGASVTIDCLTDGFPQPNVTWKRSLSEKAENFSPVPASARETRWFPNGTLHFSSVEEYHSGFYMCEAANGIGLDISKVIRVVVQRPPRFVTRVIRQRGRVGETGVLRCEPEGDLPLSFVWEKDGVPVASLLNLPHEVSESVSEKGMLSEVTFPSLRDGHNGDYKCTASNKFGVDHVVIRLSVIAVPDVPSNLRTTDVTSRTVSLAWDSSKNISASAYSFIVKYRKATETWDEHGQQIEIQGHRKTADVDNLQPGTDYRFKVAAENEVGKSKFSLELAVNTEEEAPSGPPTNASAYALSSTEVYITWSPPLDRLRNGVLLGYNVGYRLKRHGTGAPFNFTEIPVDRPDFDHSAKLGNLEPFSSYEIVVQAFNSLGAGPLSNGVLVTTREEKPAGPPRYVRCATTSSTSIKVSWEPPPREEANGIVRGYRILSELVPDFEGRIVSNWLGTEALKFDVSDMMKYSNYSFRVLAFNKEGDGPLGHPVYCMTAEDVPGPPEGVKAIQTSAKTILVSWKPPKRPNGLMIKYDLEIRVKTRGKHAEKHSKTLPGRKTIFVLQDAAMGGRVYEFSVAASTSVGQGPMSAPAQITLEQNVPARIGTWSSEVEALSGTTVILDCMRFGLPNPSLSWENGFGEPLSFNDRVIAKDDGSLVISESRRADAGQYTCSVTNAHGSDSITHNLMVKGPPGKPNVQLVKATTTNLTVQWTIEDDGGSPVRGFVMRIVKFPPENPAGADDTYPTFSNNLELSAVDGQHHHHTQTNFPDDETNGINNDNNNPSSGSNNVASSDRNSRRSSSGVSVRTLEVSRTLRTSVVEKLSCGSEYSVRLSAWNSVGSGRRSDNLVVRTEGHRPPVPEAKFVLDVNSTFAVLHLHRWTTSSCPILRFSVKYKEDVWKMWSSVATDIPPTTPGFTIDNLRPATKYEIQIRAISDAGDSILVHKFSTLNIYGVALAGGSSVKDGSDGPGFSDVRIMTPTILSVAAVVITIAAVYVFLKRRRVSEEGVEMASMKGDTYREYMLKYYTLLGKQAAERAAREEKSDASAEPEYPDDIHPYATFHLDRGYETTDKHRPDAGPCRPHHLAGLTNRDNNNVSAVVGNLVDLPSRSTPPVHCPTPPFGGCFPPPTAAAGPAVLVGGGRLVTNSSSSPSASGTSHDNGKVGGSRARCFRNNNINNNNSNAALLMAEDVAFLENYGYGCPASAAVLVPSSSSAAAHFRRMSASTCAGRLPTFDSRPSPCTLDRRRFRHRRKSDSARRKFKSLRGGLSDGDEDDSALDDQFHSGNDGSSAVSNNEIDVDAAGEDGDDDEDDDDDDDVDSGAGTSFKTSDSFSKIHKTSELLIYGDPSSRIKQTSTNKSANLKQQAQQVFPGAQQQLRFFQHQLQQQQQGSTAGDQQQISTRFCQQQFNNKSRTRSSLSKPPPAPAPSRRDVLKDADVEDSPTHRLRLYNLGLEPGLPIPVRPCALMLASASGDPTRISPLCSQQQHQPSPTNEAGGTPATILCHHRVRASRESKRMAPLPAPGDPTSRIRSPEILGGGELAGEFSDGPPTLKPAPQPQLQQQQQQQRQQQGGSNGSSHSSNSSSSSGIGIGIGIGIGSNAAGRTRRSVAAPVLGPNSSSSGGSSGRRQEQ